jgi:hypothetical protein
MGKKTQDSYCPARCSASIGTTQGLHTERAEHMVAHFGMPQELADTLKTKTIYRCGHCDRAWIEENGVKRVIGARELNSAEWEWNSKSPVYDTHRRHTMRLFRPTTLTEAILKGVLYGALLAMAARLIVGKSVLPWIG